MRCDVLDKKSLETLIHKTIETLGRVDFLINGAGGAKKDATTSEKLSFFDLPEDSVRWVFDLNFVGTFLACQVFGRHMVEQDEGSGELTERGQRIIAHTPVERFGQPEDLVGPALLLLPSVAAFVHGTTVTVDGGISIFGGV